MEQTKPTTRAEEIAAEGPYRADWENGMSVVRDLNAPEGNKIMMMMPENMEWFADRMNEAHAKGYKQGQQDMWIPVSNPPKNGKYYAWYGCAFEAHYVDGKWLDAEPTNLPPANVGGLIVTTQERKEVRPTHYRPLFSPPNPEQP